MVGEEGTGPEPRAPVRPPHCLRAGPRLAGGRSCRQTLPPRRPEHAEERGRNGPIFDRECRWASLAEPGSALKRPSSVRPTIGRLGRSGPGDLEEGEPSGDPRPRHRGHDARHLLPRHAGHGRPGCPHHAGRHLLLPSGDESTMNPLWTGAEALPSRLTRQHGYCQTTKSLQRLSYHS
jgi:hypothetical protein